METILQEAERIIFGDREKTHGDPARNLREIAAKWSVTFGVPITAQQVAIAMIDLKTVRALHDPAHRDHWVDVAGYAGLVDRCGFLRRTSEPGLMERMAIDITEGIRARREKRDFGLSQFESPEAAP